jgi:hypothetical protein
MLCIGVGFYLYYGLYLTTAGLDLIVIGSILTVGLFVYAAYVRRREKPLREFEKMIEKTTKISREERKRIDKQYKQRVKEARNIVKEKQNQTLIYFLSKNIILENCKRMIFV